MISAGNHIQRSSKNKALQERKVLEDVPRTQERIGGLAEVGLERRLLEEAKGLAKAVVRNDVGCVAAVGASDLHGILTCLAEEVVAKLLGEGVDLWFESGDLGLGEELVDGASPEPVVAMFCCAEEGDGVPARY